MLAIGLYWCIDTYQAWTDQPVLTTITTAELPIEKVKDSVSRIQTNNAR
jgi:hypothetical protein